MTSAAGSIDVHQHLLPSWYVERLNSRGLFKIGGRPLTQPELQWSPQRALEHNARRGIRASILSFTDPGVSVGDDAFNRTLAREANEYLARLIADHPGRFGAFAVLPLPHIENAVAELAYALDVLKLDGVGLLSNYGAYLGDPRFEPVFAELSRRRSPVLLHPTLPPYEFPLPYLPWVLEFVFDTTRAAQHLIFSGTLDRHPGIPIILAHGGGTLPYLSFRIDIAQRMLKPAAARPVREYFRDFHYETTFVTAPESLAALTQLVEPSHLLFGTDFPFGSEWVTEISQADLASSPLLDDPLRTAIADHAAGALFRRFAV
ncbi:MAG: amidohydrolase family protein [Acetobacteraceae bacterium]